jgi:hypothetical protein
MAAGGVGQAGYHSPALDHVEHVESGHGLFAQPLALAHAAEQWPFLLPGNSGRRNPGLQLLVKLRMAGHLVALAALLVQP